MVVGPAKVSELSDLNLYTGTNNHITSNTVIKDKYKLRVWVDSETDASNWNNETNLQYNFRINVTASQSLDSSGANPPVISENMIPVYYDEDAEVWKKADNTNSNSTYQWYDYDAKMWANSVTVSSTNRATYVAADPGTTIPMSDILTMQVWIPRYKYKVWNYNLDGTVGSSPEEINIMFEKGTAKTGQISCIDHIPVYSSGASEICNYQNETCTNELCNGKTYTHPSFTFGEDELMGIWIGKFELSGDISCSPADKSAIEERCNLTTMKPLVKPDVTSWRGAMMAVFENNTMMMNDANNIYGFSVTDDTHIIKNIDWGAVAYLTLSKYGKNSDVFINNSTQYYTGRSGGNVAGKTTIASAYSPQNTSTTHYSNSGFYTYDGYLLNYNTNEKSNTKDMSKVASTTGNIYGIYDMAAGAWEDMMADLVDSDQTSMVTKGTYLQGYYSGFTGSGYIGEYELPDSKYYDKYSKVAYNSIARSKLGDAIKEVFKTNSSVATSWYNDYCLMPSYSVPWVMRGGAGLWINGKPAGILYSHESYAAPETDNSSRLVITQQ